MRDEYQKVTPHHLNNNAYLYVRQSTVHQVFENTESTERQYALRQRAIALGWSIEQIIVIDSDLGRSGAANMDREGFQRLVAEVGMGKAGIVMGLEASRLARNSMDWHRLLEICAVTDTLILDEDGVYDPKHFNDRLLLGLKGTMSEVELHVLRARLRGGLLNKAKRGELATLLPIGLVYNEQKEVQLDPDRQVQEAIQFLFRTFSRTGSASATVKAFRQKGLLFPSRLFKGANKGQLIWSELGHSRTLQILHNPRYAGVYAYGRTHACRTGDGRWTRKRLSQEEWDALIRQAHPGYITWEEYRRNQRRLQESAQAHGIDRRNSPPREGPALLQGLVMCGICGQRMTLRYVQRSGKEIPVYCCQRKGIERGEPVCQSIVGDHIDQAVGHLLIESMTPLMLEVALHVQQELQSRLEEVDRLRRQQVERVQYEADLARRRYMQVDPENRFVADSLEADWNESLRRLAETQDTYNKQKQTGQLVLTEQQRQKILALAADFPRLWNNPQTTHREKKRMLRLVLEDVTLIKNTRITVHVRLKGGMTKTLTLPLPKTAWQLRQTPREVIDTIDKLLEEFTDKKIASILNKQGLRSGTGISFTRKIVTRIRKCHGLKSLYERLRERGFLTQAEMAKKLGVVPYTIRKWRRYDILKAHFYNEKNECLYECPTGNPPSKMQGQKLSERRAFHEVTLQDAYEVQYEV